MAIEFGASAVGLVGAMPSGPGVIEDNEIAEIARSVPPPVATFLLTSETTESGIREHHQKVNTSVIQMVDAVSAEDYKTIKHHLSGIKLVQVIHVQNEASINDALASAPHVDALLLDSGNPDAEIRTLGGTGKTHNWEISRRIVDQSPVPVFLAGGLNSQNVQRAIDTVQPYGLDLCSGVRSNGDLDEEKLEKFMKAAGY